MLIQHIFKPLLGSLRYFERHQLFWSRAGRQKIHYSEKHSRQREILDLVRQFVFLGAGVGLIVTGHGWIGGFLAAAAAYPMAKEFVIEKFPKISLPGGGHHDES
jgi:hypothetical protein